MAAEVPGMVPLLLLCDFFWGDMNEHLCIPGKALMRDQRFCSYLPWPVSKLGGGVIYRSVEEESLGVWATHKQPHVTEKSIPVWVRPPDAAPMEFQQDLQAGP